MGISCGRLALQRADIDIESYHAYEIDTNAITISQKNFPDIQHHGNVIGADFTQYQGYDLLIAGSPCQGFSRAGKQLNFQDPRSKLFFEFVRAIKEVKPKYFLLENVEMKQEYQDVINEYLGFNPIRINSKNFSAQNRPRLYWTNFKIRDFQPKHLTIKDIQETEDGFECVADKYLEFSNFITIPRADGRLINGSYNRIWKTTSYCGALSVIKTPTIGYIKDDKVYARKLTPNEAERLQTLPDDYTAGINENCRYKALGNGWTVDVIAHIFNSLK